MAPKPDPNPKYTIPLDKVDGTPYYKKRQIQPGFPGYKPTPVPGTPYNKKQLTPVPGTPYNKKPPGDVKRKALGQALQNTSRKYGVRGLGVK
jgi:hypothetical protein